MTHVSAQVSLQSHFCVYFDAHRLQLITDSNDNAIVDHLGLKILMLIVVHQVVPFGNELLSRYVISMVARVE